MKPSEKQQKRRLKPKNKVQKNLSHIPTKLRKLIANDVNRYLNILGMNNYMSKIFYMKNDAGKDPMMGENDTMASTHVEMRYLTVSVNIYPITVQRWQEKSIDDEDVHQIIAHEIAHIATNHMHLLTVAQFKDAGEVTDAWESLTTVISRLMYRIDKSTK